MHAPSLTGQRNPRDPGGSLWQTLRRFPRPVWLLFLGTFINKFGTFVIPFLALHLTRLGYSARQAGLCVGAYGAGHVAASILGGHLADTIGRRPTIAAAMFGGAACMLALSQATSLPVILAVSFAVGLAGEFYKPASSALLADLVPEADRVTAYAAYRFSINAGWAIGPATAGLLARSSYLWLFVGDAATSVTFGLIALWFLPRSKPAASRSWDFAREALRSVAAAIRVAQSDRRFLRLVGASLAIGMVFLQMPTTLGLAVQAAGHDPAWYGFILAINGAVVVLLELPLSTWTRQLPPTRAIAAGFTLIGLGMGSYAWAESVWQFAAGMVVFTLGEILSMPIAMAYAARLAPAEMRGRYLGLYGLTWAVSIALGPALGMTVFSWHSTLLWLGCAATGVFAGAWMALQPGERPLGHPSPILERTPETQRT